MQVENSTILHIMAKIHLLPEILELYSDIILPDFNLLIFNFCLLYSTEPNNPKNCTEVLHQGVVILVEITKETKTCFITHSS